MAPKEVRVGVLNAWEAMSMVIEGHSRQPVLVSIRPPASSVTSCSAGLIIEAIHIKPLSSSLMAPLSKEVHEQFL